MMVSIRRCLILGAAALALGVAGVRPAQAQGTVSPLMMLLGLGPASTVTPAAVVVPPLSVPPVSQPVPGPVIILN
jgi:hypothetical protein